MKKSKGFISISIVFSFILVFVSITSFLLVDFMQNRLLLSDINREIKENINDLNNDRIFKITNFIENGDYDELTPFLGRNVRLTDKFFYSEKFGLEVNGSLSNATANNGNPTMPDTFFISYNFPKNKVSEGKRDYLISFKLSQNKDQQLFDYNYFYYRKHGEYTEIIIMIDQMYDVYPNTIRPGAFGWDTYGFVATDIELDLTSDFFGIALSSSYLTNIFYLDDYMVIDVTDLMDYGVSKEWLLENIPYFNGNKTIIY